MHRALVLPSATLLKVLERVAVDDMTLLTTINHYETLAGYGDMLRAVRNHLSGDNLNKAMRLLHGSSTPRFKCVPGEHEMLLEAKSIAMSMARKAASLMSADLKVGIISPTVRTAFNNHFNPGGGRDFLDVISLREIRSVFWSAWRNMLDPVAFRCVQESHEDYQFSLCAKKDTIVAYTPQSSMGTVFICPLFWRIDPTVKGAIVLHEFVHHQQREGPKEDWITDRAYVGEEKYAKLTPQQKGSRSDSLSNADSYANFALELY